MVEENIDRAIKEMPIVLAKDADEQRRLVHQSAGKI